MNTLVISATVLSVEPLRYTPAGLPLLQMQLQHASKLIECGLQRKVQCQLAAVMIGDAAHTPLNAGDAIKARGFLAQRSAKSTHVVMHIQDFQQISKNSD